MRDTVVRHPHNRHLFLLEFVIGLPQFIRRIPDLESDVIQPRFRAIVGLWRSSDLNQEQLMMGPTSGKHRNALSAADFRKSEDIPIKRTRSLQIRHIEHYMPKFFDLHGSSIDGTASPVPLSNLCYRADVMITQIIFDFGGVLFSGDEITEVAADLAAIHHASAADVERVMTPTWHQALIDPKKDMDFWNASATALGISTEAAMDAVAGHFTYIPETNAVVRSLQGRYAISMLSNQIASLHQRLMKEAGLNDLFPVIVTSYEEGVMKPDERIYTRILEKLSARPEECLFIDDRKKNILAAEQLGMQGVHLTDPKNILNLLREKGVSL